MTHNPLVGVVSTAVCCSQSGGALLSVPRGQALLGGTADWDSVDAVCVTVTVTVIALAATIPWCPNKDRAFPTTALQRTRWMEEELKTTLHGLILQTYHYCQDTVFILCQHLQWHFVVRSFIPSSDYNVLIDYFLIPITAADNSSH